MYREGAWRDYWVLETTARFLSVEFDALQLVGMPAGLAYARGYFDADGGLISLISVEVAEGEVQTIRGFVNPDKIAHLGRLSPLGRRPAGGDWA